MAGDRDLVDGIGWRDGGDAQRVLMQLVTDGTINPGIVFDAVMPLEDVAAMSEAAARYYDEHLSPAATLRGLLAMPGHSVRLRLVPFLKPGGGYA